MCTRGEKVKKVKKGVSVDNFCKTPCSLYPLYKLNGRVYIGVMDKRHIKNILRVKARE